MATRHATPTLKASRFIEANRESALVYQTTEGAGCFCRLADGRTFDLTAADCMSMRDYVPRWRHLESVAA
jgi:hypothetical protein